MVEVAIGIRPTTMDPPTPPTGSDYDQSTLDHTIDSGLIVAGEMNGNPAEEHYISQGFVNTREALTGFGVTLGYYGAITNELIVGIATTTQKTSSPQDPNSWTVAGVVDSSQMQPEYWYYVSFEITDPIILPTGTMWLVCATNESWVSNGTTKGWVWGGISSAPYPYPLEVFDGQAWSNWTGFDASFFTWTATGSPPPNCPDYTTQATCEAANCYWWADNTCHSTPENGNGVKCADYQTAAECSANNCFWYAKHFWEDPSCHDAVQDMIMDYLPFILAGVGGGIILVALATKGTSAPPPMPYPYPPQQYYPPPPSQHYPPPPSGEWR